jgi:predicted  nucleic acid-binding Zn-ribbon protein
LPELGEIEKGAAALGGLRDEVIRARTETEDLDREIRRFESDIEQVRARATRDQQRLESGLITSPKELEGLQHEVATLARRQGELEDVELELMERREEAQKILDSAQQVQNQAQALIEEAELRRDELFVEIDEAVRARTEERESVAAEIPADLLALYEKIRSSSGGSGAALLRARRCGGCRLELSGSDLATVAAAAPDEVTRCEECRRILVRTAESGL